MRPRTSTITRRKPGPATPLTTVRTLRERRAANTRAPISVPGREQASALASGSSRKVPSSPTQSERRPLDLPDGIALEARGRRETRSVQGGCPRSGSCVRNDSTVPLPATCTRCSGVTSGVRDRRDRRRRGGRPGECRRRPAWSLERRQATLSDHTRGYAPTMASPKRAVRATVEGDFDPEAVVRRALRDERHGLGATDRRAARGGSAGRRGRTRRLRARRRPPARARPCRRARAVRDPGRERRGVRRPGAPGDRPSLRPAPRGRRGHEVVGRTEGTVARSRRQAPGRAGRRPRHGPQRLRGRFPTF